MTTKPKRLNGNAGLHSKEVKSLLIANLKYAIGII